MDWDEFIDLLPEPHTIVVEAYTGSGGFGDTYAAATSVDRCFVDGKTKTVRIQTADAAGAEIVSATQVWCPPGTVAPPRSRVTLPGGRVAKVLESADVDDAGLDLPAHVALLLE